MGRLGRRQVRPGKPSAHFSFSAFTIYLKTEAVIDFCGPPNILEKCGTKPQYFLVIFGTATIILEAR